MYSLKDAAAGLFVSAAIGAGMLVTGKLLPRGVQTPSAAGKRSWLLHGHLHFRMFELHRAGIHVEHASALMSAHGIKHLVLSQRLGAWEHRFVIQLLGPTVREFVAQGRGAPAHLVLQSNLGPGMVSVQAPQTWCDSVSLQDIAAVPRQPEAALLALMEIASLCLERQPEELAVPSQVQDVCVSLVLAPEYEALAASHARRFEATPA